MVWVLLWLSVASAQDKCYSEKDLWNARCDVGCQREHYSGGYYSPESKKCRCHDDFAVERVTHKKMNLSPRDPGREIHIYQGEIAPYEPSRD